jgi:hypothetical protein
MSKKNKNKNKIKTKSKINTDTTASLLPCTLLSVLSASHTTVIILITDWWLLFPLYPENPENPAQVRNWNGRSKIENRQQTSINN